MPPYIVTLSGCRVDGDHGTPPLCDIAVSLCRTPMFAGATRRFYSVGHHSLAAAMLAEPESPEVAYFCALHEAEVVAYGDTPGPLKGPGQRTEEKWFRARLFAALKTPLRDGVWDRVEFYDKVEQAASATWLGLAESVHARVWDPCPQDLKDRAVALTRRLYALYPPEEQLAADCELALGLVRRVEALRAKFQPAPVAAG